MHPRKSKFSAQRAERPSLAPHWLVFVLAVLVGIALLLLFPRQDLERRLANETESTELSTAYLANLLRSDPNNPRLRKLLEERQEEIRLAKIAAEAAAKAPPAPALNPAWKQWQLQVDQFRSLAKDNKAQRQALAASLANETALLSKSETNTDRLTALAQVALEVGDISTSQSIYQSIYQSLAQLAATPQLAADIYAAAARSAIGQSQYQLAADWYLQSQKTATAPEQAKSAYLAAIAALQSGNQAGAALEFAQENIANFGDDPEVLHRLVDIARAAGKPQVAARYMRILLQIALQRQWDAQQLALAAADHDINTTPAYGIPRFEPMAWEPSDHGTASLRLATAASNLSPSTSQVEATPKVSSRPRKRTGPQLTFDNKTYTLGYEVFLESGNLDDAWLVAQAAVRQAPTDMVWRERLAKVSDWTQRGAIALEHWLVLARTTQRDDAWQSVLRLAPGLFADEALLEALRYELKRKPKDMRLVQAYIDTAERLAQPKTALAWLAQHNQRPEILLLQARLAQRAGDPQLALKSWKQLLSQPGWNTTTHALEAASLALLQGQGEQGLAWLEAAQPTDSTDNADNNNYWRLTAQVADLRQQQALAARAYRQIVLSGQGSIEDFDGLIRALQIQQPLQAAEVAVMAWEQHQQSSHLVLALSLYANRNQWSSMEKLLSLVIKEKQSGNPSAAINELFVTPEFLRLAGTYYQNEGNVAQARLYYEAGLQVASQSNDMRQALLWLYIDGNDTVALRQLLGQHEPSWSQDTAMHNSLAASYQALSQPQVALDRYLRPRLKTHQRDFLWLMNYADALDQNQDTDKAWRLRRYLLSTEWQQALSNQGTQGTRAQDRATVRARWLSEEGLDTTRRIARTRLILSQRPGDPALEALRELLRLDRDAKNGYSNAAAETAIGWLQDAGEYNAERGFLWHQYARTLSLRSNRPLWADITVALAEQDKASTGQLLSSFDERLPRYDRVNAARAVDDIHLAQTAAFETQDKQPDDNPLHLQLTENLLEVSDYGKLSVVRRVLDGITELDKAATLHLAISPRLSLNLRIDHVARLTNNALIVANPTSEQGIQAALMWRNYRHSASLSLGHRTSLASYNPLELNYEYRWDPRLALLMSLGSNLSTQEGLALRMGGTTDEARIGLRFQATARDQFILEQSANRYQLQTGAEVGTGNHTSLNYLHNYRLGSPSLDIGGFWSRHSYSRRDPTSLTGRDRDFVRYLPNPNDDIGSDYFLPNNFQFYGVQLQTNMRFEEEYTRKLQPFARVARTWHSEQGPGYSLQFGIAGSIWGADHFSLKGGLVKSGTTTTGLTRELQILYRIYD